MIVDAHLHLFRPASDRYPRGVHPLYPAGLDAPADELLSVMDAHGVDRAVVVPLEHEDDYLAEVLDTHPDRFLGVGVLDDADADPVASTRRRHDELGLQGLRLGRIGRPGATGLDGIDRLELLATLAELDMNLWFYGPPEQLALLPAALREVPQLTVVLNHLGFCPTELRVDHHGRPRVDTELPPPTLETALQLAETPNVHVMFSGQYAFSNERPPYCDLDGVVHAIGEAFGLDRLLWASDWPWIRDEPGYGTLMSLVDHYFPAATPSERAAVMGGTTARLFHIPED